MSRTARLSQGWNRLYGSSTLVWLIIGVGIILRASQFLFDRSLWLDEARLAMNILTRSCSELAQPLDYHQGAPIAFLLIERTLVQSFGTSEYILRLFPFLCGLLSLFLFYKLAMDHTAPGTIPIAVGFFAISYKLIYYSSEVKQYSCDVLMALLICVAGTHVLRNRLIAAWTAIFAAVGAVAVWFSHPAAFVLAGAGVTLTLVSVHSKDWRKLTGLMIVCSVWMLSFAGSYVLSLRELVYDDNLVSFWAGAFAPFPPRTASDLYWLMETFIRVFNQPLGFFPPGVAAFAFLVGGFSLFPEKKKESAMLTSPLLFALLASGLRLYPFWDRFLLFGVPLVLPVVAEGAERVRIATVRSRPIVGLILMGLLFAHPVMSAGYHLMRPRTVSEIKPVLAYVDEAWQQGDVLYVYHAAWPTVAYYASRYGLTDSEYIVGAFSPRDWGHYAEDLGQLAGKRRVWILFAHDEHFPGEKQLFLANLDSLGTQLGSFSAPGASVYLYDLRKAPGLE